MTILLTACPFCGSNFMVLNTDTSKGLCSVCSKERNFTKEEISEAEAVRDRLSEQYMGRLQEAFDSKDHKAMKAMVEEVANAGVSSWYAWFCIGWSDLHEGNAETAFQDLSMAVMFLDEENFDEFYELTMEAVIESLLDSTRNEKEWYTPDVTMTDFTGSLYERFGHLCENGDFMTDLMIRLSTVSDEIGSALMGDDLIREILMMITDYIMGDTFIPDQQDFLNNARLAVEEIDSEVQKRLQDGSVEPNLAKIWGPGLMEFIDINIAMLDRISVDRTEEDFFDLCDYWNENDYEGVFTLWQNALEYHTGYITSNKHNKGILKKRDKALQDYEAALIRPLVEGLVCKDDRDRTYDRVCPDCGKYLKADDNGVLKCECGFKTRIVTDDVDDLPKDAVRLTAMGEKALADRDAMMLNNIGERLLEFDQDNWFGFALLAESCLIDGEFAEAIMLMVQAAENLPKEGRKQYRDMTLEILCQIFSGTDDQDQQMAALFLPALLEAIHTSQAKDCNIPVALLERMIDADYDDSAKGYMATMALGPVMAHEFMHNTSLNHQRRICVLLLDLMVKVEKDMDSIKKDQSGLRNEALNYARTSIDLLRYLITGIDSLSEGKDAEKVGYMAGYWGANTERYKEMVVQVIGAFHFDEDMVYKADSNTVQKSRHELDRYLQQYMEAGKE
ncbi:hypothetical protein AUP07_0436 [methanogenic archaeon mixed culture ISO4-G1]|nr:hypothetical protein AUP07_0436 [methanogenic archaeon mixed culture ISO4-G1]